MTALPADTPWLQREDLRRLVAALGAKNARYVGGAVRDTLLGLAVRDIDIATPFEPREVMRRLKAQGIKVIPTGIDHGTVTAILPGGAAEITTLRRDVSTDGRRATVAFAQDWQADAARRDFTINALYADPLTGEVFDWFGGLEDLEARTVRFIGDPEQRIREDHLRILRYFRFQARFGSQPADADAENACAALAATLKGLSRERVGMEIMNLLGLPDPAPTIARMAQLGVLQMVLPEADDRALKALVAEEVRQGIAPDPLRRMAALIPADVPAAEQIASRFRLSGAQKKRLALAAGRIPPRHGEGDHPQDGGGAQASGPDPEKLRDPEGAPPLPSVVPLPQGGGMARALAYRLGRAAALDRLLLAGADTAPLNGWEIPTFPLKGGDIVARGIQAGPDVSRLLKAVEARWVDEQFPDAARVSALLDAELGG